MWLYILTHINSLQEGIAKIIYLREHRCKSNIIIVPKQIGKHEQVSAKGNILVDDYYKNNIIWEEHDGISVRFNKDGEEKEGFITISNLDNLLNPYFINYINNTNKKKIK